MKKMVMPSENQCTGDDFQHSGKVPKARREIQNNYFYHYLDFASSLVFTAGDMETMEFLEIIGHFFFFFVHSHFNEQNHHFLVWNLTLWESFLSLQKMYNILQ